MDIVIRRLIAGVLLLASFAVVKTAEWSYDPTEPNGPQHWGKDVPACNGGRQSPIDLVDSEVTLAAFDEFQFQGYDNDTGTIVSIENFGHTARVQVDGIYRMSGGGLPTEYQVVQAHFHWGTFDQQGSEHAINGKLFPLEMHIVHYAYDLYGNGLDALESGDSEAFAVLGVLFEIGKDDNEFFDEIITGVSKIVNQDIEYTFTTVISLTDLLPEDKSRFYRYSGSLTTPPCNQVVAWTVFEETVKISPRQMATFRNLKEGLQNESHITGNTYRPLQPRNDREVYYCANAVMTKPLCSILVTVALLLLLFQKM